MATQSRRKSSSVADTLFREPFRFSFLQAVRILEFIERSVPHGKGRERRVSVGNDANPADEVVRFTVGQSQSFPASEVVGLSRSPNADGGIDSDDDGDDGGPPSLSVVFFGLTGPSGVLPDHYNDLVLRRGRERDTTLRDFFDCFNHRSISLFHRATIKYNFPIDYETRKLNGNEDNFTSALFSLTGFGGESLRARQSVKDESIAHYAGHFAHFPRSASALESMVRGYFRLPAVVEQFVGQWLNLDQSQQSTVPGGDGAAASFNQLGVDTVIGPRVWDMQSKFKVILGPLNGAQFARFLPNGERFREIVQLTRTYAGLELSADLQLILKADEVPMLQMAEGDGGQPMLGWNTWLSNDVPDMDVDDVVISMDSAALP